MTVIVASPFVVPGVTVTIAPLIEHVAILSLLDLQLSAPPLVFLVTSNVPLSGYVYVAVVLDIVNVLFAFPIVVVTLASATSLWLLSPTTL